jgi:hypothetical protein
MTDTMIDKMRPQLLTLEQAQERLSRLEPLSSQQFEVGQDVMFRVDPGWHQGVEAKTATDPVECFISIRGKEYQMSKDAFMEATNLAHMKPKFVTDSPAKLVEPALNHWYRQGHAGKDFKILEVKGTAQVFTKQSMVPYSNLKLVEAISGSLEKKYGQGEILVDYKFHNELRATYLRLVVPGYRRVMTDTDVEDDTWSTGIQLRNSLTNATKTELSGYLFRWWCTNGAIEQQTTWDRRADRYNDYDTDSWIYDWARDSVDEILGHIDDHLDLVQQSAREVINADALREIFEHYGVPAKYRQEIINELLNADRITLYAVMQAMTRLANQDGLDGAQQDKLMRIGADIPGHRGETCDLGAMHFQ